MRKRFSLFVLGVALLSVALFSATGYVAWAAKEPIVLESTCWDTFGKGKSRVQRGGSSKGPAWIDVYYGPDAIRGLAANEFVAFVDDGEIVVPIPGTYQVIDGKKIVLEADNEALADAMDQVFTAFVRRVVGGVSFELDIFVQKTKLKAKVKSSRKRGDSLQFSAKVGMIIDVSGAGGTVRLKAAFAVKSSGPRC